MKSIPRLRQSAALGERALSAVLDALPALGLSGVAVLQHEVTIAHAAEQAVVVIVIVIVVVVVVVIIAAAGRPAVELEGQGPRPRLRAAAS